VHEVVSACGAEIVARHTRSNEGEDFVCWSRCTTWLLIERKIDALDQKQWCCDHLDASRGVRSA